MYIYNNLKYNFFPFNLIIDDLKKLTNNTNYIKYLDKWLFILSKYDDISQKEMMVYIQSNLLKNDNNLECFQFIQSFPEYDTTYEYNFDIEKILNRVKNKPYKINFTKFLINHIDYDKSIKLEDRAVKTTPIIICPFLLPTSKYIVIDGNTRLNYNIKNHKLLTKFIIYPPNLKDDFMFSIDWAMYHFINDINDINFYLSIRNIELFLEKSILNCDIFNNQLFSKNLF